MEPWHNALYLRAQRAAIAQDSLWKFVQVFHFRLLRSFPLVGVGFGIGDPARRTQRPRAHDLESCLHDLLPPAIVWTGALAVDQTYSKTQAQVPALRTLCNVVA